MTFIWTPSIIILIYLTCKCLSSGIFPSCNLSQYSIQDESDIELLTNNDKCHVFLVESIPENLTFSPGSPKHLSTYLAWKFLIDSAKTNISIASFYWSLFVDEKFNFTTTEQGSDILQKLIHRKGVDLKIAQNGNKTNSTDLMNLTDSGAHIKWLDFHRLVGRGILHTKLWLVDTMHSYLGSANMDWRSLTQVKELGVLIYNCPEMIKDLEKIWKVYWFLGNPNGSVPDVWPVGLHTIYNRSNPLVTEINGMQSRVYFSSSPMLFNPPGRNDDLDALLSVINDAEKFIYISVMNYFPEVISYEKNMPLQFWPVIDDALRKAAIERSVEVRLLISKWKHSMANMYEYLGSIKALNGISSFQIRVRYFIVPSYTEAQMRIPYARVNHNKYMVTDKAVYIGTSNWSGDYFLYTGGIAFIYEEGNNTSNNLNKKCIDLDNEFSIPKPLSFRKQVENIFRRDWNSEFAYEL
ncbi:Phospholipase D3 [Schistosoma japonicum]|nr:Phospholipase D3 [Schistosoma japonicum]